MGRQGPPDLRSPWDPPGLLGPPNLRGPPDLRGLQDLRSPPDLQGQPDLRSPPNLRGPPDLWGLPDLRSPPNLRGPPDPWGLLDLRDLQDQPGRFGLRARRGPVGLPVRLDRHEVQTKRETSDRLHRKRTRSRAPTKANILNMPKQQTIGRAYEPPGVGLLPRPTAHYLCNI
jgi:hypothetical protein